MIPLLSIIQGILVQRIVSYPNSKAMDQVNTFHHPNNKIHFFAGKELLKRLCFAATAVGPDSLGAAMAVCLAHDPIFTIMLFRRWSSDAFLCYIRKQVKEFSNGISSKMILDEHFFKIPSSSCEDPRTSNHPLNLASRNNSGPSFKDTVRPLASVFH